MSQGRRQPVGPLNPYNQTTLRKSAMHPQSLPSLPKMLHQLQRVPLLPWGWQQRVEGYGVPSGQLKEAHDVLNRNEAVSISLNLKIARDEVGVIQLSAEMSRIDLVQHKKEKGGACRGSVRRDR